MQTAEILDRIGNLFDAVFEFAFGRLGRLFKTFAGVIELPAVIGTANAFFVYPSVSERRQAVRAMFAD